jgi:prepilin-type N-terminal cleavage/methylation domain-containing protein
MEQENGFTLVEVIIVMTTVAIISTASVSTFSTINRGSADAKRSSDIYKITLAQEEYYSGKKCYSADLLNNQNFGSDTYMYATDGSECPKWYVMFSKLQTGNTGPTCNVTSDCLPVHYQPEWGCVVSGSYDCAVVSALVLPEKQTTPNFIASVSSLFGGTSPTPIPTTMYSDTIPTVTTPTSIIGTTTPSGIGGTQLPPVTSTSDYKSADDGTWCYDSDGNGPIFYGGGMSVELSAPYTTVGFCIDTNGIHNDYCNSSGAMDWYCNGTWSGSKWSSLHCAEGGFVCNSGSTRCINGACADPNPPLAIGSTTVPVNKTLIGSDGTWCNDNGIVNDMLNKNSCQDNSGIKTDYCFGKNKVSYHCIGNWNGASYTGVKCGGSIFSCTSCVNAVCMSYVAPTGVGGS